jgi:RecB family exonuclease
VITARTTRLVRAPDLQTFRRAIVDLACAGDPLDARDRMIVVPTRAAASYLLRAIEDRYLDAAGAVVLPDMVTPDELIASFGQRLMPLRFPLSGQEREVLAGVACRTAIEEGNAPPFRLRPGLIAEIVAFYDSLRRHLKDVDAFERLALGALEPGAAQDRGAERLVRQTRFLASAFRHFECLEAATGRTDEHMLRSRVVAETAPRPWRHAVVCVGDYATDRNGLMPSHWDVLARVPGLERLDVVATDGTIAGAFHERIHQLLPGIEECRISAENPERSPALLVPPGGLFVHIARDREDEVAGFARWVRREVHEGTVSGIGRTALVVRRPLPYVYLTREVMRSASVPLQMFDALPLASEPFAAALDVVITFVAANFSRRSSVELLRSPHFSLGPDGTRLHPVDVALLDRALSEAGYLGDLPALERFAATWEGADESRRSGVATAAAALVAAARRLAPLHTPASGAEHLRLLESFLRDHESMIPADDQIGSRDRRGRAAVFDAIRALRTAYAQFDPSPVVFTDTAAALRRWIDAHTFAPQTAEAGVHLVDADTAKFGDFDAVQLAGLVDGEWPDPVRRNIFYPPGLLRDLGWPAEGDRLDGVRASFVDLLGLATSRVVVSAFALEDDATVSPSTLVDALSGARMPIQECATAPARIFEFEALGLDPVRTDYLSPHAFAAASRRLTAGPGRRTGYTTGHEIAAYSLSGLERYQDCPFKFFATDVLKLEEPPEDEPMLSPRARGRFVHEVFQRFFEAWDAHGCRTVTVDRIDEARQLFATVAEPLLGRLSEAEAALERARLFGSAAAVGVVDVVLGLEASRQAPVVERWLEHRFEGCFSLGDPGGSTLPLKGVADRVDLLEGRRLRVIDYKSGYAPQPRRALQAPIYALCARESLQTRDARDWQVEEASYVAFSGKRSLVPVVKPGDADAARVLGAARQRATEIAAAISSGAFPPRPYELRICGFCPYPSVCRKDYVGDD